MVSKSKAGVSILDSYVTDAPTAQAAIDIFKSEWSSVFPAEAQVDSGGHAGLFEDPRVGWFLARVDSLAGKRVLELGPLEGAHSYMMQRAGADSIIAIEANTRAYLKCLVTKALLGLDRAKYLLGDFVEALKQDNGRYDVALASGVIYHMKNPAELIAQLARTCTDVYVWTHYHDENVIAANKSLARMFDRPQVMDYDGFRYTGVKKAYGEALGWAGFSGGSAEYASWMPRADLLACFEHFGLKVQAIEFEQIDHPNGPCFAFHASRMD